MRKLVALAFAAVASMASAHDYVAVPGGAFTTTLRYEDAPGAATVAPFRMMTQPVTNAEFLAFAQAHPQWRRDNVASVFAAVGYLGHWPGLARVDPAQRDLPVTRVSWFAASAYCAAQGARLVPTPRHHVMAGLVPGISLLKARAHLIRITGSRRFAPGR